MAKRSTPKASPRAAAGPPSPAGQRSRPPLWQRSWFPAAVFALLSLAYFSEFVLSDKVIVGYDVGQDYHRGEGMSLAEKAKTLCPPLWTPEMGGYPTAEQIRHEYFPAYLIYLFTSFHRYLGWRYILTVFLAGWAMYLYLREIQVGRWAALWTGVAYLSAPTFLSFPYAGHYAKMSVIALFPLMGFFLERGMRRGRLVHFAGLGATIGVAVYSPHLQMVYYALLGTGSYFLFRTVQVFRQDRLQALRRTGLFAVAVVLGLGLGAEGLFPSYLYTRTQSKRAGAAEGGGRSQAEQLAFAQSYSLHPEEVGSLLVPEFGGFDDFARGERRYWGRNGFKTNSEYFGVLVVLLALVAVPDVRRRPLCLFMGGLFLLALLYSLGGHTPVHGLAFDLLPGAKVLRTVGMSAFLFAFAACVLAAVTLDRLLGEEPEDALARRLLYAGGVLAGVGLLVAVAPRGVTDLWISFLYSGIGMEQRQILAGGYGWLARGGLAVALVAAGGTVLLYQRRRVGVLGVVAGLGLLGLVDTWRIDRVYLTYVDPDLHPDYRRANSEVVGFLQQDEKEHGPFRVLPLPDHQVLDRPEYHLEGATVATGRHDFAMRRYDRLLRELEGPISVFRARYYQRESSPYTDEALLRAMSPLLGLLNVRYIVAARGVELQSERFPRVLATPRLQIYRNPAALDWFRLVPSYRLLSREEEILQALGSGSLDPPRTVVLEEAPPPELGAEPADAPAGDSVEPLEYDLAGGRIRLRTQSEGPRMLVISLNYHPYWTAAVDARPAHLQRADYVWQGVFLPAGRHEVELVYRSPVLAASRTASLVSLGVLAGVAGWEVRRRRKEKISC
ncbi:MAG: hypothetical protein AB1505_02350 [Candidatus Latescibacterota bacterium]